MRQERGGLVLVLKITLQSLVTISKARMLTFLIFIFLVNIYLTSKCWVLPFAQFPDGSHIWLLTQGSTLLYRKCVLRSSCLMSRRCCGSPSRLLGFSSSLLAERSQRAPTRQCQLKPSSSVWCSSSDLFLVKIPGCLGYGVTPFTSQCVLCEFTFQMFE